jgi:DNA-binding MarR family transcriptional regulator
MTDQEQIEIPTELASSTPATKLVYVVLDNEGPLTQRELIETTALSETGVQDALDRLEDQDLVTEHPDYGDARHHLYRTT